MLLRVMTEAQKFGSNNSASATCQDASGLDWINSETSPEDVRWKVKYLTEECSRKPASD